MRRSLKASAFSFGSIFVLSVVTLGYQNCSQFSANLSPKQEFLAKNRIFSSTSILPPGSMQVELPSQTEPSAPVSDTPTSSAPVVNQPAADTPVSTPVAMDAPAVAPTAAPAPAAAPVAAGTNGSAVGVVTDPGSRADLPMENMCSTGYSNINFGETLENVQGELKAVFVHDLDYNNPNVNPWAGVNTSLCEFTDPAIKANLKQNKILTLIDVKKRCPQLQPGTYRLAIVKTSQNNNFQRNLVYREPRFNGSFVNQGMELDTWAPGRMLRVTATARSDGQFDLSFPPLMDDPDTYPLILWAPNRFGQGDPNCIYNVSPLLVQLRPAEGLARGLEFTAQFQGVLFDILGLRALPVPFTKQKISWLSKKSAEHHYFIVLPDAQGNVTGIEQLFGDNTSGPDGKFAKNGYLALAKWDGRRANGTIDADQRNGLIDSGDPVYSSLRFWRDENRNGVTEKSELHTLASLGVTSIDLNYDKNYSERDRFGNEIKMKSIVRTTDGRMHVMYDVWFRLAQ